MAKDKGGLALRNLSIAKHSLKVKHVFNYLNWADIIWVNIVHLKYRQINFWKDSIPRNCSWYFQGLYHTTTTLKPFCGILSVNPSITSLLYDPWCSKVPLALMPTYMNMHVNPENFSWQLL